MMDWNLMDPNLEPAEATRLTGGRHSGQLAANDA